MYTRFDELEANVSLMHEYKNTHMMAFTETWLDAHSTLGIEGFGTPILLDRDKDTTGKECGGGVCVYINENWCNIKI